MKIGALKRDSVAINEGVWIEKNPFISGVRFKVRGDRNMDARRLTAELINAKSGLGGELEPEDQDKINSQVIDKAVLLDWDGLTDEAGEKLVCDDEARKKYLCRS